jgi:hypothetical protein
LIDQYCVQTYFFIRNFNEIYMYSWSYNIKIIVYSKASVKSFKSTFFWIEYTLHIFELNVTLQQVGFKSYLNLEKSTWNLLLQCKFFKLMHNNEEVSCYLSFN